MVRRSFLFLFLFFLFFLDLSIADECSGFSPFTSFRSFPLRLLPFLNFSKVSSLLYPTSSAAPRPSSRASQHLFFTTTTTHVLSSNFQGEWA
jgi:hypothetical protein